MIKVFSVFGTVFVLTTIAFNVCVSQWTQLNGPECAAVNDLALSNDRIYAACKDHLYYTDDLGASWKKDSYSFTAGGILSVAAKKNYVFAGTAKGVLYRSSDAGLTWEPVEEMIYKPKIRNLVWHEDTLYACTEFGLYRSKDFGIHWQSLNKNLPDSNIISLVVSDTVILIGVSNKGVYRSKDHGSTWSQWNDGIGSRIVTTLAQNETFFYAGTDSGLFRLSPASNVWTMVDTAFSHISVYSIQIINGSLYVGTNRGLIISNTLFSEWRFAFRGEYVFGTNDILPVGGNIFIGTALRGVHVSSDSGNTWRLTGTINRNSYVLFAAMKNSVILASNQKGVFLSTDEGNVWQDLTTDSVDYINYGSIQDSSLYALSSFGLYRKMNAGAPWKLLFNKNAMCFAVQKNRIYIGTWEKGLYYSSNYGATFEMLDTAFLGKIIPHVEIIDSTVLVTSRKGIFISRDDGQHWARTSGVLFGEEITSYSRIDSFYFGASGSYIFRMNTGDSVWVKTKMSEDLYYFYYLHRTGKTLFVTGMYGLFYTTDYGEHWIDAGYSYDPPTSNMWSTYAITSTKTRLFVGSNDSGIWWKYLKDIVNDVPISNNVLPQEYALHQNYPNPFNPTTNITFTLSPSPSPAGRGAGVRAILKVFNSLGQEVAVLVNEVKAPGRYSVAWDASRFASGMYVARFSAGNYSSSIKLMLVK